MPVKKENSFSKSVLEKRFPIVFRMKMTKKTHKIIFTDLAENLNLAKPPFIDRTHNRNTFMRIEIASKAYISVSF